MNRENLNNQERRKLIRELVTECYQERQNIALKEGTIHYAGRVFDSEEVLNLIEASLEFWLTAGHYTDEFERGLADYVGVRYCAFVNSGSSANLCAFMALTAPELGKRKICKDDEVITVAAAFPTTVFPIIQYGAIPVFLDITIPQYNMDISILEKVRTEKTKAVFLAHTLGNPFDVNVVKEFCDKYNLWLIEDNCDALGSEVLYRGEWRKTGTFGDISTYSFYPPHHITTGEGGAVCTDNPLLARLVRSFRDWGRDCWCASGVDDTCGHRYTQQFGELPYGYDHKYVYSHFGYNLKATDLQAAIGCAQLKKLPHFVNARKENWKYLREELETVSDWLILPECMNDTSPSWFGFLMTVREDAGFSRDQLVQYLESKLVQTRMLFSGNLLRHPCFDEMRKNGLGYRKIGDLKNTDKVMKASFWIGVYPGMTKEKLDYMISTIKAFVSEKVGRLL